jgi:hypothetical protein
MIYHYCSATDQIKNHISMTTTLYDYSKTDYDLLQIESKAAVFLSQQNQHFYNHSDNLYHIVIEGALSYDIDRDIIHHKYYNTIREVVLGTR